MVTALAVGMISIAAILFYKLVERPHKIVVAKVSLGALLLAAMLFLAALFDEHQADKRSQREAFDKMIRSVNTLSSAKVDFLRDSLFTVSSPDSDCHLLRSLSGKKCPNKETTVTTIFFRICNRSEGKTITRVRFVPKTMFRGRSTAYYVETNNYRPPVTRNTLESDRVLRPRECAQESWSGSYDLKDSTFADVVEVDFSGELPDTDPFDLKN